MLLKGPLLWWRKGVARVCFWRCRFSGATAFSTHESCAVGGRDQLSLAPLRSACGVDRQVVLGLLVSLDWFIYYTVCWQVWYAPGCCKPSCKHSPGSHRGCSRFGKLLKVPTQGLVEVIGGCRAGMLTLSLWSYGLFPQVLRISGFELDNCWACRGPLHVVQGGGLEMLLGYKLTFQNFSILFVYFLLNS